MPEAADERVLILMPTAKDGERTARALAAEGLSFLVCKSMEELCRQIELGAGVALLTEEAHEADQTQCLRQTLAKQPPWSDFPLVFLAREGAESPRAAVRETLNVTLVERPLKIRSLLSVVRAGLRARRHQYGVREHLAERLRVADTLKRSEERYRALVEATSQAVWSWSPLSANGDFEQTQIWWERITGQTPEEQMRNPDIWLDVVHPQDRSSAARSWSKALESGLPYDVEYRVRTRTGNWCFILARGVPVRGSDGQVREWVGTLDDISERRRAELENQRLLLEVEAERRRLADVFQNAPSFMAVLRGKEHIFERANDHYYDLVGRRDIIGRSVQAAVPEAQGQGFFEILDRVYQSGEPFIGLGARILLLRGGVLEERFVDFVFQPLRDSGNIVSGIIVQGVDLTERRRAEQELIRVTADSERQKRMFETALSNTPDFIFLFDLEGRFTYINKSLLHLWQKTQAEAVGKNFRELDYPAELADRLQRQIEEVIQTRQPVRDDTPYTSAFGTRAYEYIFVPVFGADGEVEAVAGSTRDITERKRSEQALRHSEELLRLATDAAELGVWMWDVEEDRVTWENDRPYRLFGLDRSHGPLNAARFMKDFVLSEDAGAFREAVSEAVRTGERFDFLGRMRRTDGEVRWVEFTGLPLRRSIGAPLRMHGTAADVTERKRAEEALRTSESEFRATFEGAGVGKAQADPETGLLVRVNPKLCELLDYTADELLTMTIRDLIHPDDQTAGDEWFRALVNGEIIQNAVEMRYLRKTKEVLWVRVTATIVRASDGRPVRVSAIIEDVTARMDAEEALKAADRKKDDFIAMLAHELRNPLAPIRNGLQVMHLCEDRDTRARSQKMMDRQLSHMVRLIDDLLDVSRITRNKMELRRAQVSLADVLASAVETARPAIEEAGHELTMTLPDGNIVLDADLTRLSQVFSNLLTNSAKYTEKGGRLWLSAERQADEVAVSVRDNGTGIPAEALPNVFNMFSQVDRSLERSTGGLGIGLALVKGLVEMHGGRVSAFSAGEGQGSTFTVYLPVLTEAAHEETVTSAKSTIQSSPNRRILVVDDNRDGAESLAMMLELIGNSVALAHDGVAALEQAEKFRPEVIFMDVGMPRLNGLDATKRIRLQPWGRAMKIIALTGWGQEHDRERSREAGCDGHLVKPVGLSDLEQLLTNQG